MLLQRTRVMASAIFNKTKKRHFSECCAERSTPLASTGLPRRIYKRKDTKLRNNNTHTARTTTYLKAVSESRRRRCKLNATGVNDAAPTQTQTTIDTADAATARVLRSGNVFISVNAAAVTVAAAASTAASVCVSYARAAQWCKVGRERPDC
jgi:hypothetical protein